MKQQGLYLRKRIWWIRYRSAGKTQRESSHSEDQAVALEMYRARVGDISRGITVTSRTAATKIGEILDILLRNHRHKRSSVDTKTRVENHLRPAFGEIRANELTGSHLGNYIDQRQKDHASNASINRELSLLHRAYGLAKRGKVILIDPPLWDKLPEPPPRAGFFTDSVFNSFVSYLPVEIACMIRLARITGWRIEILKSLEWRHLDLERCIIRPSEESDTKKTGFCPYRLNNEVRMIIAERLLARIPLCPYVFHRDGEPIQYFRRSWATACKQAKCVGLMPHDLRRTAARIMVLDRKIPATVAMQLMGIRNEQTLYRYVGKPDLPTFEEAVASLDTIELMGTEKHNAD